MDKIVRSMTVKSWGGRWVSVFCRVSMENGRVSITGVIGPTPGGNAVGGCGQIDIEFRNGGYAERRYARGWTPAKWARFLALWGRWHLNDMRAGTPEQEAYLRGYRAARPDEPRDYARSCDILAADDLLKVPFDGTTYKYGAAWLKKDVPAAVLAELAALPDADRKPAWV